MLDPDVDARQLLTRERRAQLVRDASWSDTPKSDVKESRMRRRGMHMRRFRLQLRPARGGS